MHALVFMQQLELKVQAETLTATEKKMQRMQTNRILSL
jgi:hypothetical protein